MATNLTSLFNYKLKQFLSQESIDKVSKFLEDNLKISINQISYFAFAKNLEYNKKSSSRGYIQQSLGNGINNEYANYIEDKLLGILIGRTKDIFIIFDIYSQDDIDIYVLDYLKGYSIYSNINDNIEMEDIQNGIYS
ncbi:MAG: hypothetical protein GXW90_11725 [Tepidanaerobacter acetatoxydans]|uniref:hypothetical protein n=1 Tax=Tepidanaerobacter acetatoxydans TaxID=499229 RepID=UPI0026EDB884|nr:hypothetical protein [Tepidanaerobacter acetatoxydans]NLU11567.1 hypothetical protein [Tepidanaerobacter acetatoxydans]